MGPVAGDVAAVPAQQGVGSDQPPGPAGTGEHGGDGAEQAAVGLGQRRAVDLSAQDHQLVTEHDDLDVLVAARAGQQ